MYSILPVFKDGTRYSPLGNLFSVRNVAGPQIAAAGLHFRVTPVDQNGNDLCYGMGTYSGSGLQSWDLLPGTTTFNQWFFASGELRDSRCWHTLSDNTVQRYKVEWALHGTGDELGADPFVPHTALSNNNIVRRFVTLDTRSPFDWAEFE